MDGNDIAYLEHLEFMMDGTEDLLGSLVQRDYFLEYQPIIQFEPFKILGFEALIRLASVRGPIPACAFVPLAERNGAMDPIGFWALEEAVSTLSFLHKLYEDPPFISVNLSGVQLELHDFPAKFMRAIEPFDLNRSKLVLDIAHNVFLTRRKPILDNINWLVREGFKIHADHFDPRMNFKGMFLIDQVVDRIKWPADKLSLLHENGKTLYLSHDPLRQFRENGIHIIVDKIDSLGVCQKLQNQDVSIWGQGYALGQPLGLESSLNIFNRHLLDDLISPLK